MLKRLSISISARIKKLKVINDLVLQKYVNVRLIINKAQYRKAYLLCTAEIGASDADTISGADKSSQSLSSVDSRWSQDG